MKSLFTLVGVLLVSLILSAPALAGPPIYSKRVFNNYSGVASVAAYSSAINTGMFTKKTVLITGEDTAGTAQALAGTAVIECGPTSTGPFVPCKDIGGAATSATANATFDLNSIAPWIRLKWTKTTDYISVWLYYSE